MKITSENKEFPYVLIDDFYDQSELDEIWEELDYMCNPRRMPRAAVQNGAAWERDEDGNKQKLKTNWTMWLDNFFGPNRHQSNICLLYTSPSPRDRTRSRMPSSA